MALTLSLVNIGSILLQSVINTFGVDTIVAHTAARRLTELFMLPFSVLGQTMATYCGQNRGAGRFDRIRQGIWQSLLLSWGWCVIVVALSYTAAPPLIGAVTGSAARAVIETGSLYLRVDTLFYAITAGISIIRNALQGIGDHVTPIVSSAIELVGKLAVVLFLTPKLDYFGVILAEPIVWALMVIPLIVMLLKNPAMQRGQTAAGRDPGLISHRPASHLGCGFFDGRPNVLTHIVHSVHSYVKTMRKLCKDRRLKIMRIRRYNKITHIGCPQKHFANGAAQPGKPGAARIGFFVNRSGRNRNMARLKMQVMDEKGLGRMKDRVERMLEERGVHIDHPALCAALADKGCKVQDGAGAFPARGDRAGGCGRAEGIHAVRARPGARPAVPAQGTGRFYTRPTPARRIPRGGRRDAILPRLGER